MTHRVSWRKLAVSISTLCLAIFLVWSLLTFLKIDRASAELPRLFLQLERAIGYDGFIHNFKNFVLRPGENAYFEAALEDYLLAENAIQAIDDLTARLQIETNLEPLKSTLRSYRAMLDIGSTARIEGLSIAEVDNRIRVSDTLAGFSILQFQEEINTVLNARHLVFSTLLGVTVATLILATAVLTYTQYLKRRQAEDFSARLAEKTAFIEQAERIAKLGRWTIDADGRLICSQATMDICGVSEADFVDTTDFFWTIVPPVDQPKLRAAMNKAVESASSFVCIHSIQTSDSKMITVVNSGEAVVNAEGEVAGFVGAIQDISHLADMEDKLRQAQKMEAVGNLAGGMAHDFNNILAVIVGNLELLQISTDAQNNERYLTSALDAAKNGADLTRNMLSFARRSPLEPKPIEINKMVRDVVNWSARLLPATIHVETSLLANLWQVEADSNLAQSALLNLLLNARDAMPDGGRLTIETSNVRIDEEYVELHDEDLIPGRYIMLAVSDTGEGMTESTLQKIFDPFFSTKPPAEGSGLGLPMVLGFMKQSNGTVRVYSELGVGTTFKLYFKVSGKDPAEFHAAPLETPTENFRNTRILLVEDNAELLETLKEMLTGAGFDVATACSGDEAFEIWTKDPSFDVVVTDIVMPGKLQGTHLAKQLRKLNLDIPFIFMSGYSNEAAVHGNGLRPEDIRLMKPVNRKDIITAIVRSLPSQAQ